MPVGDAPVARPESRHRHPDLRTRDEVRDATGTIRGSITAVSRAFGRTDPTTTPVVDVYPAPPQPATVDGTASGVLGTADPENRVDVDLTNIGTATITGTRARLRPDQPLTIAVTSDGDASVRIDLPLPADTTAVDGDGNPADGAVVDDAGADLVVAAGSTTFVLVPGDRGGADVSATTPDAPDTATGQLPATGGRTPTGPVLALASAGVALAGVRWRLIRRR